MSITIVDSTTQTEMAEARAVAANLLHQTAGPDLADDRFEPYDRATTRTVLAIARSNGRPAAYVEATASRGRLQFDTVADVDTPTGDCHGAADDQAMASAAIVSQMIDVVHERFTKQFQPQEELVTEVWGRPRQPWHDHLAAARNLVHHRTLYQMRCELPLADAGVQTQAIETRPIDISRDTEKVVTLNNRAFSYHPDQSNQSVDDVREAFLAPGFEPASVRILDSPDHKPDSPRLGAPTGGPPIAGFCWTKIHEAKPGQPGLGEIYVIAVDPDFHGQGLGVPLTAAGLAWMANAGLRVGMLYVEADNGPAVRTYEKLGFAVHANYTAWRTRSDLVDGKVDGNE